MGGHQKNCPYSAGKQLLLGSLFGFFALSWFFLLPLVYYCHLSNFSFPARLAAENSQDYAFLSLLPATDYAFLVRLFSHIDSHLDKEILKI